MRRLPIAIVLLALAAAAPAKLYKWVDEDGNVTYSERKPPDKKAEEVKLIGVPEVSGEQARKHLESVTEKADSIRKDREFKQTVAGESAERDARLKENCETARQNLRVLEAASRVKAESGEFLDDAQRKARVDQTRKDIENNCG